MSKQIELWDVPSLDSFNKQRPHGGHQGRGAGQSGLAQHPEEGVGQGGEERGSEGVWGGGGWLGCTRRCGVTVMSACVKCNHC